MKNIKRLIFNYYNKFVKRRNYPFQKKEFIIFSSLKY